MQQSCNPLSSGGPPIAFYHFNHLKRSHWVVQTTDGQPLHKNLGCVRQLPCFKPFNMSWKNCWWRKVPWFLFDSICTYLDKRYWIFTARRIYRHLCTVVDVDIAFEYVLMKGNSWVFNSNVWSSARLALCVPPNTKAHRHVVSVVSGGIGAFVRGHQSSGPDRRTLSCEDGMLETLGWMIGRDIMTSKWFLSQKVPAVAFGAIKIKTPQKMCINLYIIYNMCCIYIYLLDYIISYTWYMQNNMYFNYFD